MQEQPQPPIRLAAGIVIDDGKSFILQRRDNKDGILWPGKISLWGGAIELEDEGSSVKNAFRELREETGLTEGDVVIEPFGELTYAHQTLSGEAVEQRVKLFVAKINETTGIHVYEGAEAVRIPRLINIADIDYAGLAPGVIEALAKLGSYYEYQAR